MGPRAAIDTQRGCGAVLPRTVGTLRWCVRGQQWLNSAGSNTTTMARLVDSHHACFSTSHGDAGNPSVV
jgi:hypothetical protein